MCSDNFQGESVKPIHSFERPPLVETVLGVQFKRIPGLTNSLLHLFWDSVVHQWPNVEDVHPIELQYERFGNDLPWMELDSVGVQITRDLATRLRITNEQRSRMIQVQNGRFHYNWLATNEQNYPRYSTVRKEFFKIFEQFQKFLSKKSVGPLEPDQWEITYVDHIPKGTAWNEFADLPKLFKCFSVPDISKSNLCAETFFIHMKYELKPQAGRLYIKARHGLSRGAKDSTKNEIIRIDSTARGPLGTVDLKNGLDLGRESIVKAFYEMTDEEAHKYWGYKNAG